MGETTITIEQHIAAPPAQVWATIDDTRRFAEWVVNTLEVTRADSESRGRRRHVRRAQPHRRAADRQLALGRRRGEPPRHTVHTGEGIWLAGAMRLEMTVEPDGDGTRYLHEFSLRARPRPARPAGRPRAEAVDRPRHAPLGADAARDLRARSAPEPSNRRFPPVTLSGWPSLAVPTHTGLILLLACVAQFMVILDVVDRERRAAVDPRRAWTSPSRTCSGSSAPTPCRSPASCCSAAAPATCSAASGCSSSASRCSRSRRCSARSRNTEGLLIGARALQGLGGAIVAPATLSIITTTFHEGPERNRALGIWGSVAAAGGTAGALVGGLLTGPAQLALDLPRQRADRAAADPVLVALHPGEPRVAASTAASTPRARSRSRSGSARSSSASSTSTATASAPTRC